MDQAFDIYYQRDGEYIRNPSEYFIDRLVNEYHGGTVRDFDAIVHDLRHGYDSGHMGGMSLTTLVQRFVGPNATVTQENMLSAIRAVFTQMYESGYTHIDEYSDLDDRAMFDMLLMCHPNFDTKFRNYLPSAYKLDKDTYENWIVTVIGYEEFIICTEGDYLVLESKEIVDDVSWVKAARNAVRMFKGCTELEAGFGYVFEPSFTRAEVVHTMRKAVDDQISDYRRRYKAMHNGVYVDAVDGKELAPLQSHVDHYPISFARLVDMWFAEQQCDFKDIALKSTVGDFRGLAMSDVAQRESWQQFHRRHAGLRIVSEERNMSLQHY